MRPQNNSKNPQRDKCGTPAYALEPLLKYLDGLQGFLGRQLVVWESAAGEGLLARYLSRAGYKVIATDYSNDHSYLGEGVLGGLDRFSDTPLAFEYDIEVTNVPFSRKFEWLKAACETPKPFALLSAWSLYESYKNGGSVVDWYGVQIVPPQQRIDYKMPNKGWLNDAGKSNAQMPTAWFTRWLDLESFIVRPRLLKGRDRHNAFQRGYVSRVETKEEWEATGL